MRNELNQAAADQLAQGFAGKVTFGSAVAGLFGYLSQINWIGLSAVLFGLVSLIFNIYFMVRRDRREKRESDLRIKAIHEKTEANGADE